MVLMMVTTIAVTDLASIFCVLLATETWRVVMMGIIKHQIGLQGDSYLEDWERTPRRALTCCAIRKHGIAVDPVNSTKNDEIDSRFS